MDPSSASAGFANATAARGADSRARAFRRRSGRGRVRCRTVFRVELREGQRPSPCKGCGQPSARVRGGGSCFAAAPASAEFRLDGTPVERQGRAHARARLQRTPPAPPCARAPPRYLSNPRSDEENGVPRELTRGSEEGITSWAAWRCGVRAHTPGTGNLTIRVRTSMVVDVEPHGEVAPVRFDPPLSPAAFKSAHCWTRGTSRSRRRARAHAPDGLELSR